MKFNNLKDAVQFRICESEDNYWIEDYWTSAIEIFTKNVSDTILFILNECDDEEFYWLSEIFEELAEKTQSKELIGALRSRLATVNSENYHQQDFKTDHMRRWIDYTEYIRQVNAEIDYAEDRIDNND